MSEAYRLRIFDKRHLICIYDQFLVPNKRLSLGRGVNNDISLPESSLHPHHIYLQCMNHQIIISLVPGAPNLHFANKLKRLFNITNRLPFPITICTKGVELMFDNLIFQIIAPNEIRKNLFLDARPQMQARLLSRHFYILVSAGLMICTILMLLAPNIFSTSHQNDKLTKKSDNTPQLTSHSLQVLDPQVLLAQPPLPNLPALPLPTPAMTFHTKKEPTKPAATHFNQKLLASKNNFLLGQEQAAIDQLLKIYEKFPFNQNGKSAAQAAKTMHEVQLKRNAFINMSPSLEDLDAHFQWEKVQLGAVSHLTQMKAMEHLNELATAYFEQEHFVEALHHWQAILALKKGQPHATHGLARLEQKAEIFIDQAYAIKDISPERAKALIKQALNMTSISSNIWVKGNDILKKL